MNNEINNCSWHGVYLVTSERNNFTDNRINNNGYPGPSFDGIYLNLAHWNNFTDNTIKNNRTYNPKTGIYKHIQVYIEFNQNIRNQSLLLL